MMKEENSYATGSFIFDYDISWGWIYICRNEN